MFPSGLDQQPLVRLVRISCCIILSFGKISSQILPGSRGNLYIHSSRAAPISSRPYRLWLLQVLLLYLGSWLARLKRSSRPATASAAAELQRGPGRTPPNQHR